LEALNHLMEVGEIQEGESLRLWMDGEWRETQIRRYDISDQPDSDYEPEVADLLNAGLEAFQREELELAERLFQRALELDPRAKHAYNNLGTIYAQQGKSERARETLRAALEIDSLYVLPRCNLAHFLLGDGDAEGAAEMIRPLADVTEFHPQDMAFYAYTQAHVLLAQGDHDAAQRSLQIALEFRPDYAPAQELMVRLKLLEGLDHLRDSWTSFAEEQRKRDRAKRLRLQTKLTTLHPTLSEALATYTKDALTGIGRVVNPWGGWSGLRKAELAQEIVNALRDAQRLADIVEALGAQEQTALRAVLDRGGTMPWADFDGDYGNDLDESPYWNYHKPEATMGHLRLHGLLVEATVDGELFVVVPVDLRGLLSAWAGGDQPPAS
jgi:Tfp pilus assembly protein PilF